MRRGRSEGARHGGITVSDLDRSLEFYVGLVGLELVWRREYVKDEIRKIVGIPDATSVDIAMLDIPGGGAQIELLEYKGCERKSGATPPSDYGTGSLLRLRHQHRGLPRRARCARGAVPLGRPGRDARGAEHRRQEPVRASTLTGTSSSSTSGRPMSLPDVASAVAARPADRPPLIDQFRLMLPDSLLRGARRDAVRAGRDLRHGAQLRRPGGDRRRRGRRDARDRLPRRPPPLPRPPDRRRRRSAPDDGRDVRQADGVLQGPRRLDAHRRSLARHPRLQRHRRRRDPPCLRGRADRDAARHRPGDARVLRRRRRRAGRHARGHEPGCDLEAARRLHLREQPVRALCRLAHPARGRGSRRSRCRLRHAGRGRRRQRRPRRRGRRRPGARSRPQRRRPDASSR